ncbi:MAG: hypothetical protein EFT35_06420 [Methanophagales archaeon ANME-1-THS]|nr:MAG: hypothetical protein EFT35_06420 [Methanophagales archaeon ANME-1-THS]
MRKEIDGSRGMKREERKKPGRKKLIALLTLSLVFLGSIAPFYSLPIPSVVPTATAIFSSITITGVRPTEFSPGETSEVIVTVKNNGGIDARDIRLAFQGTQVVSLVGPTVMHINTLNSWSSTDVRITIHIKEEAPTGVYSIPVNCSWREYYFNSSAGYVTSPEITKLLGLSFSVTGSAVINVGDVTTDPAGIRPGDRNVELRAVIENSGEAAAKDIEAKMLLNDKFTPSWSGTDRSYIGRLNSGEKSEAVFHLDIAEGIASGTQTIPLQIRYKDTKGNEYEVMREVAILVKPKPAFEITSYYTVPMNLTPGYSGVVLYVTIRNVGSAKAESASVRMTGEANVPFDYDVKSDFVGNLAIGEAGTAILKFDVDTDAVPKGYPIGIEIRCTGDRNLGDDNVYLFNKEIKLDVTPGRSPRSSVIPGFGALSGLIALIFVFAIGARLRKRV